MNRSARCCAVLATPLAHAGCGGRVSANTITIGISGPASGAFAAQRSINDGAEAYFRMLNGRDGGINGRKIAVSRPTTSTTRPSHRPAR